MEKVDRDRNCCQAAASQTRGGLSGGQPVWRRTQRSRPSRNQSSHGVSDRAFGRPDWLHDAFNIVKGTSILKEAAQSVSDLVTRHDEIDYVERGAIECMQQEDDGIGPTLFCLPLNPLSGGNSTKARKNQ